MTFSPSRHRKATTAAALVVGLALGLSAMPIYPCEDAKDKPMTKSRISETQPPDNGTRKVADLTTNASASATASSSSSSSSSGKGDCVAESSASAKAEAGDERKEDHDSAREVSRDGDCEARSSSRASARTGGGSPSGEPEKE